jgi:hypothetical protein
MTSQDRILQTSNGLSVANIGCFLIFREPAAHVSAEKVVEMPAVQIWA